MSEKKDPKKEALKQIMKKALLKPKKSSEDEDLEAEDAQGSSVKSGSITIEIKHR